MSGKHKVCSHSVSLEIVASAFYVKNIFSRERVDFCILYHKTTKVLLVIKINLKIYTKQTFSEIFIRCKLEV